MTTSGDVVIISSDLLGNLLSDLYKAPPSFGGRNETVLATIFGMLAVIALQLFVEWYKERRFAKTITVSFCAEVESILNLIVRDGYKESLDGIICNVQEELKRVKQSKADIDQRRDLFEPFLEMNNANVFSLIYSLNSQHVGLMEESMARDIVKFYVLTYSLLEKAMLTGRSIIKNTEFYKESKTAKEIYEIRLDQLKRCYETDLKLLQELISLGQSIVGRTPKTGSLWYRLKTWACGWVTWLSDRIKLVKNK